MPITPTYPGVYIEEVPSGVRTLTGVATSITAFVGRAQRGPVDEPSIIFSFADYERIYGGLWTESLMGYAVRDFFLNGGAQAVIVRVFTADTAAGNTNPGGRATLVLPTAVIAAGEPNAGDPTPDTPEAPVHVRLTAVSPGAWGSSLEATVDPESSTEVPDTTKFFNLIVRDSSTGNEEVFLNVTVDSAYTKHPGYLPAVLDNQSSLVSIEPGALPDTPAIPLGGLPSFQESAGNDGLEIADGDYLGSPGGKTGLYALEKADLFNLLCIPDILTEGSEVGLATAAAAYCEKRRAMLLIDPPETWTDPAAVIAGLDPVPSSTNAAIYFPRLIQPDPLRAGQLISRAPCGAIAGIISRTDTRRGIWKAPAGLDATINGTPKLSVSLTDNEIGLLNPLGVNCLKSMPPAGRLVWGARTRKGADQLASEWKYIPIRRLALYIEESLYRGTQWVVFEPNDEPLWAQIRLNLGAFMNDLFRKGAFQGSSPSDAYFVKCDKETTTQSDINLGIVNIVVGFAPLKPAEFVIIKLQQIAGQLAA